MPLSIGPFQPAAYASSVYPDSTQWLVPGIIPTDGLVILASAPKTGKTCFATALARAVATGTPFLGHDLAASPVLWCAHEEAPNERAALHEGLTEEDPFLIAYPDQLTFIDAPGPERDKFGRMKNLDAQPYVFDYAKQIGARLIVIDSLHAAVESGNLADNHFARKVIGRLRLWCHNFHVSVLVLHHLTKSATRGHQAERFADSAQILAASSCHFFLERTPLEGNQHRVTLFGRGRHPSPVPRLDLISTGILDYQLAESPTPETPTRTSIETQILELLEEGWHLKAEEIAKRLNGRLSTVRCTLSRLTTDGRIAGSKSSSPSKRYGLVEHLGSNQNI